MYSRAFAFDRNESVKHTYKIIWTQKDMIGTQEHRQIDSQTERKAHRSTGTHRGRQAG